MKTIYLQIQVAQQGPGRIILKQNDKTCYKKFLKKNNNKILKATGRGKGTRRTKDKNCTDTSSGATQARSKWYNTLKC